MLYACILLGKVLNYAIEPATNYCLTLNMKRTKKENKPSDEGKPKEPKWWITLIAAPIIVGLVIWIIPQLSENKYGELQLISNVDSASVSINQTFKGLTSAGKTLHIASLRPGTHIVSVQKEGFASVDTSIQIAAGQITSIRAESKLAGAKASGLHAGKDTLNPSPPFRQPAEAKKSYSITVIVTDRFKNAKIMIDGEWVANASNTVRVSEGRHILRVENDEFYYEEMIQVPSRDLINISDTEFKSIKE
jgi:hypothetical protein